MTILIDKGHHLSDFFFYFFFFFIFFIDYLSYKKSSSDSTEVLMLNDFHPLTCVHLLTYIRDS